jgi:hypothetical protein
MRCLWAELTVWEINLADESLWHHYHNGVEIRASIATL